MFLWESYCDLDDIGIYWVIFSAKFFMLVAMYDEGGGGREKTTWITCSVYEKCKYAHLQAMLCAMQHKMVHSLCTFTLKNLAAGLLKVWRKDHVQSNACSFCRM